MNKVSILGCGWLGSSLAEDLIRDGVEVNGSTTTPEKMDGLAALGIRPFLTDLSATLPDREFLDCDVLVIAVPPKLRSHAPDAYLERMRTASAVLSKGPVRQIIFLSSTSVYPDLNRVVTEVDADSQSPLRQAEEMFLKQQEYTTSVIRFAGLVGPKRHPGRFLSGKKVTGGENPVNLIHRDDCIKVIRAVMKSKTSLILNACADRHPAKREFYTHAAQLLNLPPPMFEDSGSSAYKIISNDFLKTALNYKFRFPDPMTMTY